MEREALKLALEALENHEGNYKLGNAGCDRHDKAITAIKAALAQPAQEPVAHLWECLGRWSAYLVENGKQADCSPPSWLVDAINKATTPPLPVQEPVASVHIKDGCLVGSHRDESKPFPDGQYGLWPIATPPLPEQEPIGSLSVRYFRGSKAMTNTDFDYTGDLPEGDYELYTAPPQRTWIWLSDADIAEVVDTTCQYTGSYEEFLIKKAERKIRSMNNGT